MHCERCQQEATIHEVVVRDGEIVEKHLCEQCAAEAGLSQAGGSGISIADLIGQYVMAKEPGSPAEAVTPAKPAPAQGCPGCGMTYADFKAGGLLGCGSCYSYFEERLGPLLERAHEGSSAHVGKAPRRAIAEARGERSSSAAGARRELAMKITTLEQKLAKAVKAEQYELAATLRDELAKLSSGVARSADRASDTPADSGMGGFS
ncbi:MAG: hypothetical protein CMJ31_14955 [Phycisphaerae bacterium]|nr:hypothetical protein [Phycisphaerae bacterium]